MEVTMAVAPKQHTLAVILASKVLARYAARKRKSKLELQKKKNGQQQGKTILPRTRRTITEIYNGLGPVYFRRAYRMTINTFWDLHSALRKAITQEVREAARRRNQARSDERKKAIPTVTPSPPRQEKTEQVSGKALHQRRNTLLNEVGDGFTLLCWSITL